MTHTLRKVYVALFFGILLVLFGWSLRAIPDFQAPPDSSLIDGKWAKAFESHYDKEFPVKRLGTNVWAAVDYLLFGEGRPGVVVGRDDWLYSDEEFHPVANSESNIEDNWALIRGVQRELDRQGIKLVLAILPAKTRLYPEHLPDEQPSTSLKALYGQFRSNATDAGMTAPDLLSPLQQAKQDGAQVFLRTDTHWTPSGAEIVARQLGERIRGSQLLSEPPRLYVTENGSSREHQGDLVRFLPLDPLFSDLLPPPDQLQQRTTQPIAEAGDGGDALFGEAQVPVALVGTSYSANPSWNFVGALRQALQSDVVSYAEDGHGPILPMLKYLQTDAIKQTPPQVVIWEFPERYLPMANDLSGFDPAWLARLTDSTTEKPRLAGRSLAQPPSMQVSH